MTNDAVDEPQFRRVNATEAEAVLAVIDSAFDRWPPFEINVPRSTTADRGATDNLEDPR